MHVIEEDTLNSLELVEIDIKKLEYQNSLGLCMHRSEENREIIETSSN